MRILVSLLIVAGTLAFGAVYPWGYLPLFSVALCVGLVGLVRRGGVPLETRVVAIGISLAALAISAQLIRLPRAAVTLISPHTTEILSRYSLTFATTTEHVPFSIDPDATALALLGLTTLGVFLIGLPGLLSPRDLRALPRDLMLAALPVAIIGIFGREHNNGLVYGFWQPVEGNYSNGFGPFVNRNHFAGWMLMMFCLSSGFLLGEIEAAGKSARTGLRRGPSALTSPAASRIALTAMALVAMATSLTWSLSRSGIVSMTVAFGCFTWLILRRRSVAAFQRVGALAALILALFVGFNARGPEAVLTWFGDTRDFESRLAAWHDGWTVVRDFPITGTGLNTFGTAMLFYQRGIKDVHLGSAHNDYLQLLAEGGVLVAVPAVIAVTCLIVAIRRNVRAAQHEKRGYWIRAGAAVGLIGIAVQETAEFSLQIPANALLFGTLAAIALAPVAALKNRDSGSTD